MIKRALLITIIFMLGWIANSTLGNFTTASVIETAKNTPLTKQTTDKQSPYDWVKEDQIKVYKDKIILEVPNAVWARFTDTNSMDPIIDENSNAIELIPRSPEDIHVGDIVSYESEYSNGTIIHRVVRIGYDDKGWYAIMKGDNNPTTDPGKIRFEQIKRVVVAIIY